MPTWTTCWVPARSRSRPAPPSGHTPGSVSLYAPGLLFSGDTLFRGSVGRWDLGGNRRQLLASILDRLLALPDDTRVLPGHMQETSIGAERQTNPFILEAHAADA